jgi:hypothetical protein
MRRILPVILVLALLAVA